MLPGKGVYSTKLQLDYLKFWHVHTVHEKSSLSRSQTCCKKIIGHHGSIHHQEKDSLCRNLGLAAVACIALFLHFQLWLHQFFLLISYYSGTLDSLYFLSRERNLFPWIVTFFLCGPNQNEKRLLFITAERQQNQDCVHTFSFLPFQSYPQCSYSDRTIPKLKEQ